MRSPSVNDLIAELDSDIKNKREEVETLRKSDAPPADVARVEEKIDTLTGQLLTLIDHTRSIT